MGYGGDLIFSAAVRELSEAYPDKEIVFKENIPTPLDRLTRGIFQRFHLYRTLNEKLFWRYRDLGDMFLHNPRITSGWKIKDKRNAIVIDRKAPGANYVKKLTNTRFYFKDGNAIEIICNHLGVQAGAYQPELYLTTQEEQEGKDLQSRLRRYVVIEPNTKLGYYGVSRAWFFDRWQEVVDEIKEHVPVIQVGVKDAPLLEGAEDYRGKVTLREAAGIIKYAVLFLGTDGGLMHVARAVNTKGVIIFTGCIPMELSSYSDNINIEHLEDPENNPYGYRVPHSLYAKNMLNVTSSEVVNKIIQALKEGGKNHE